MTASAFSRCEVYEDGLSMSPFCHDTAEAHDGGVGEEDTEDQFGSPERLEISSIRIGWDGGCGGLGTYDIDVTAQPRPAAALHMRLPGAWSAL